MAQTLAHFAGTRGASLCGMRQLRQTRGLSAIILCAITALGAGCAGRSIDEQAEPSVDSSGNGRELTSPITERAAPQTNANPSATRADGAGDLPDQVTESSALNVPAVEAACDVQPQGTRDTPTEAEFRELLVGRWLLCDSASVFGTTDEVGLIIHADFTWQKLLRDEQGNLVAASAWEQSGDWESIDTSDMNGPGSFQLNLHVDGSGTIYTHPVFAVEPSVMRLDNNGVFIADYLKF